MSSLSPSTFVDRASRTEFGAWLAKHTRSARREPHSALVERFRRPISFAAAYRAAVHLGVKGHRHYASRFDVFWKLVDWRLPDAVLSDVWNVDRSNIRARRVRLGRRRPYWSSLYDRAKPAFARAIFQQRQLSNSFNGPRPQRQEHK